MKYNNIIVGKFISRPNRFIANVEINGKCEVCHVKNTGRCGELLIPGKTVFVQQTDNPLRKTLFDLISVDTGNEIINIDSQIPNKVFKEWLMKSNYFENISLIKPECRYKNSRFDFYIEAAGNKIFAEVKGVNLKKDGVALFPDAPTLRGIKHLEELMQCKKEGFDAYVFFIVQMNQCKYFSPNKVAHPEFAKILKEAAKNGVYIKALRCSVTSDEIEANDFINIRLD